jgi:hypothetical protein
MLSFTSLDGVDGGREPGEVSAEPRRPWAPKRIGSERGAGTFACSFAFDKVWRQSAATKRKATKRGDKVWRRSVETRCATGRRKGGAALLPSNCEPLCGRNNRPCPLPLPTAAAPTGAVGVTEPRTLTPDPRRRRRQESAGSRAFSQKAFLMLQTGGSFCIVGLFLRGSGAIG